MSAWVWIDGDVVPAEHATVAATDRGLLLGEGVFETVAVVDGRAFALGRHLERLRRSAHIVGLTLPWTERQLRQACADTIATAGTEGDDDVLRRGRLRITVTGGPEGHEPHPTLFVWLVAQPPFAPSAAVAMSPWPVNECSPLVGAKTTSRLEYTLALTDARRRGADEAILVNTHGALVEGSATNLFLVVAGRLSTPSLATGCLGGVTRSLVTEAVEVAERHDLTVDDLRLATEAFLTSTTRGVQPIASVDGHALRSAPGPLTASAHAALEKRRAADLDL